jgi:cyanate permease
LPPLIIHREFNAASFVVVMGLSNAVSGTIGALGPGFVGLVRSWRGDYDAVLVLCIALELVAAVILVQRGLLNRRQAAPEGRG